MSKMYYDNEKEIIIMTAALLRGDSYYSIHRQLKAIGSVVAHHKLVEFDEQLQHLSRFVSSK